MFPWIAEQGTGLKHADSCVIHACGWALSLTVLLGLSACEERPHAARDTLALVNGQEITASQIDDEAGRIGLVPDEVMRGKLLDSLIDRTLLQDEALRHRLERDPQVRLALENARARILAQAYLQSKVEQMGKPSRAEVEDYYRSHPAQYSARKLYEMKQLLVAEKDFDDDLKLVVDAAKSMEDAAAWLDGHGIRYAQGRLSRSSADMPAALADKLVDIGKDRLFVVNDGKNTLLMSIESISETPVDMASASASIEKLLLEKRRSELTDTELARLRAAARLEYPSEAMSHLAAANAGTGKSIGR